MAELVKTVIKPSDAGKTLTYTAAGASDYIADDNADQRLTVIVSNVSASSAGTFTLKAGNGCRAGAGDFSVTVPVSGSVAVPMTSVDSARVKNIGGANSGKILTAASGGTLSVAVISIL